MVTRHEFYVVMVAVGVLLYLLLEQVSQLNAFLRTVLGG